MGLRVSAIFRITGFQSVLHLGALSDLTWIAACSVRSKWEREGRAFRILILFQAIVSSSERVMIRSGLDLV